jgi:hypothetical protein
LVTLAPEEMDEESQKDFAWMNAQKKNEWVKKEGELMFLAADLSEQIRTLAAEMGMPGFESNKLVLSIQHVLRGDIKLRELTSRQTRWVQDNEAFVKNVVNLFESNLPPATVVQWLASRMI